MRIQTAVLSTLALAASSAGAQQVVVTPRASAGGVSARALAPSMASRMVEPRAVIGVSTAPSTGPRDTLGLLVSSVTRNSPAEKAGIEEGNRIAMINGVNLKLSAADLGDPDMERLMGRRLTRELDKLKPGDDVDLRVYGSGQTRTVKVKTIDPETLYETNRTTMRRNMDERATIGISLGSMGSKRDTLGVFVMAVDENGPAAKAGLEEGYRIASINGVDLRVSRDDVGDDMVSATKLNRLERELGKAKAGEVVELRIVGNGQSRTVKVTTVAASSLRNSSNSVRIMRSGDAMAATIRPPMAMGGGEIVIDGERIGATVRRAVERAQTVTGERLEDLGRVLDEVGRGLNVQGGTIRWFNDGEPMASTPMARPIMAPQGAARRTIIQM